MLITLRLLTVAALPLPLVLYPALHFVFADPTGWHDLDDRGRRIHAYGLPDVTALLTVAGVAVALAALIFLLTLATPAATPGAPRRRYVHSFVVLTALRFLLVGSLLLVTLAWVFVVENGPLSLFWIGYAGWLALMVAVVFPWRWTAERHQARLDRAGGTSYLREDLGL